MRKGLLFSALALGMGLFSCTQEDLTNRSAAAGGPVTVSVGLPEGSSRSVPTAPEGYDLRCVLQVVYGDGNETLTLTGRQEMQARTLFSTSSLKVLTITACFGRIM